MFQETISKINQLNCCLIWFHGIDPENSKEGFAKLITPLQHLFIFDGVTKYVTPLQHQIIDTNIRPIF